MFKIGCCIPGGSFMPQGVGKVDESSYGILAAGYKTVIDAGFDYAEATVGLIMSLTEPEFLRAKKDYSDGRFKLEVCNSFIPTSLPVVSTPPKALADYVDSAMLRMTALGVDTVVFGSGKARSIPDGENIACATEKIYAFLRVCNEKAEKYGMTVALEPLNSAETNFLNRVSEGAALAERLKLPKIKLLADAYHMSREKEDAAVLSEDAVRKAMVHVHVSESDRSRPGKLDDGYLRDFAKKLKASGYNGRVTCECSFADFVSEAPEIAEFMKLIF